MAQAEASGEAEGEGGKADISAALFLSCLHVRGFYLFCSRARVKLALTEMSSINALHTSIGESDIKELTIYQFSIFESDLLPKANLAFCSLKELVQMIVETHCRYNQRMHLTSFIGTNKTYALDDLLNSLQYIKSVGKIHLMQTCTVMLSDSFKEVRKKLSNFFSSTTHLITERVVTYGKATDESKLGVRVFCLLFYMSV